MAITLTTALIACVWACIWWLSRKLSDSSRAKIQVDGFIVYLKEGNSLKPVPRYDFSEDVSRYISSAFAENDAYKRQWDKEPLSERYKPDSKNGSKASIALIREAAEYYVLERLSTHLTDYFNRSHLDKSELKEFSREDVPKILLQNRFMELFSAPMENRAIFSSNRPATDRPGKVVMSMGPNGAFYSRFDLVLPRSSKITRDNDWIVIDTDNFILKIGIEFDGMGYVTPRDFAKYYLGLKDFEKFSEMKVRFKAEVEFKILSIIKRSKWDYHAWLDGFFDTMCSRMSGDEYFSNINWEAVSTMIHCGNIEKTP